MVAGFLSDGSQQETPEPRVSIVDGVLTVEPQAPGHSLEYRIGASKWHLYSAPIVVAAGDNVEVRAIRYGWEASEIVPVQ